jgi:hypothetical protein
LFVCLWKCIVNITFENKFSYSSMCVRPSVTVNTYVDALSMGLLDWLD